MVEEIKRICIELNIEDVHTTEKTKKEYRKMLLEAKMFQNTEVLNKFSQNVK